MGRFLGFLRKQADLASSQAAVDEAIRNVERKVADPSLATRNLQTVLKGVAITSLMAELPGVELVAKDRHILGAAVGSECSHLLTGDERHFKHLFGKVVSGVRIVHAAMLASELVLE